MNVVLLCRVSTNHQDYNRQVNELTEYCNKQGWTILRVFANKVSGAKKIEERQEILDLIDFVKTNAVDKVVCLEISRLGRNTLEALKVIQTLNEIGVCLHIKNYNLEIAQMERLTIAERMTSGRTQYIAKCKADGKKMGRPSSYRKSDEAMKEQYAKDIALLKKGISLRNIHAITGTSIMTIRKVKAMFVDA